MKWSSAISTHSDIEDAISECVEMVKADIDENEINFACLFVSPHYSVKYDDIPDLVYTKLGDCMLLGCSGGGIIGGGVEVEQSTAVSLTVASLPGVNFNPFYLSPDSLPDLDSGPDAWAKLVNVDRNADPQFIVLADPMSFPCQNLILGLDFAFSESPKIGGLASGGQQQGQNALFLDRTVHRNGAVGVALTGNVQVDTVVAQGCRPIGSTMRITESRQNMLIKLDDSAPLTVLRELFQSLDDRDRNLMRTSLFLGVVMDEMIDLPQQGDFLIRNVMGMDEDTGVLAIGEMLKEGQLVQFHLRDAETSSADISAVLNRYSAENRENALSGALLFSCLGRGQYLYGTPNHDTEIFHTSLGNVPLGGFFCNGEIGPVSGTTFLHGYTSSFGIFRSKMTE
ncbi:MAG: hypothetical protein CL886_03825 [Dehalococcoidia bacterium]|nr:hypothetical protein [Dehalococcoidia bacterium]